MTHSTDYDVIIIGGGPAGAGIASYLAMAGVNCAVFEKEIFPRPHVGESLVPASNRVLHEIGAWQKIEEGGFIKKYGAFWTSASPRATQGKVYRHSFEALRENRSADIYFDERKQKDVDETYTYHVDREKFDLILLKHAQELGAEVFQGIRVKKVVFDDKDPPTVNVALGTQTVPLKCKIIVDASGRSTCLGNQLRYKVLDPVFNQYAVHSWFKNYDRPGNEIQKNHIHIHFLPLTNTWMWQIPITDDITSIGVVTQRENIKNYKDRRDEFFWEAIKTRPDIFERLSEAHQIRGFTTEGDYSYAMKQFAGDRFVLIGDAARFVDPIFSSGVSVALHSARFASHDIVKALNADCYRRKMFGHYEKIMKNGTRNWYEFITLYYRLNLLFTKFVNDPRYRLDVLKLLQGDVYDEAEPPVLRQMRKEVTEVEDNPNHVFHQFLGSLTNNRFRPTS